MGRIRLSLRAMAFNHLQTLELAINDQPAVLLRPESDVNITWDVNSSRTLHLKGVFDAGEAPDLASTNVPGPWALFEWIYNSEANSGGAPGFYWIPRSGVSMKQSFGNNQTKEYKIEIMGPDARPLDRRSLAVGSCPQPIAK
jgi:hypothetical protein